MTDFEKFYNTVKDYFNGNEKLSKEEVVEEVKQEIALEEEPKKVEEKQEEIKVAYATSEQLSEVKNELLSMIKALIEENSKEKKEVPTELSKEEVEVKVEEPKKEVELAEQPKEIVHSPENLERKESNTFDLSGASPLERIQNALNK